MHLVEGNFEDVLFALRQWWKAELKWGHFSWLHQTYQKTEAHLLVLGNMALLPLVQAWKNDYITGECCLVEGKNPHKVVAWCQALGIRRLLFEEDDIDLCTLTKSCESAVWAMSITWAQTYSKIHSGTILEACIWLQAFSSRKPGLKFKPTKMQVLLNWDNSSEKKTNLAADHRYIMPISHTLNLAGEKRGGIKSTTLGLVPTGKIWV